MCELLQAFPGWEAIKTTKGHYRSCGKLPEACCVSHLIGDEPLIRSGRAETYEKDKDTGRYWDAGAVNVHWLIATDDQLGGGIREALARVRSPGVFVEGNSFTDFVDPDFFIMLKRSDKEVIKKSAKRALKKASALFVVGGDDGGKLFPTRDSSAYFSGLVYSGRNFGGIVGWISSQLT